MSGQWFLKVYDNFHYQDEDETYERGHTHRPATRQRRARNRRRLAAQEKRHSQSVDQLLKRYRQFGEDPIVLGPDDVEVFGVDLCRVRGPQIFAEPPSEDDED